MMWRVPNLSMIADYDHVFLSILCNTFPLLVRCFQAHFRNPHSPQKSLDMQSAPGAFSLVLTRCHSTMQSETIHYDASSETGLQTFEQVTNCTFLDHKDLEGHDCAICLCGFDKPSDDQEKGIRMEKCNGHFYHLGCVNHDRIFKVRPPLSSACRHTLHRKACVTEACFSQEGCIVCPNCKVHYGVKKGVQPQVRLFCNNRVCFVDSRIFSLLCTRQQCASRD
jgi:hypothetical protein